MAATLLIREKNGAGGTATDKTSGAVRFKTADDATVDNNARMSVPGTGQVYSFEKWLRVFMSVAPAVDIQNLEFYTDGANGFGAGVKMWARAIATYATPAQPLAANDPPEFPDATGAAADLSGTTRATMSLLDTLIDSAVLTAAFDWTEGSGWITLRPGLGMTIAGEGVLSLRIYDATNPEGIFWLSPCTFYKLRVKVCDNA